MLKILICLFAAIAPLYADLSPAQRRIEAAERALERRPDSAPRLADLALAYTRRARETADSRYYDRALEAIGRALEIEPTSHAGARVRVWALLGKHEFAAAYEAAADLRKKAPDDIFAYALLADAAIELGRYDEALEAVQWMLDLRPGNVPGLTRAAYLRELHGWIDGAADFMRQALERTPSHEREDRAWLHVQLAHLEQQRSDFDAADAHVEQALELFPGYHYALAERGRIRMSQDRYDEAVASFAERYEAAPHPENLYELAAAQRAAGLAKEATASFRSFVESAREESTSWDNANRELIAYLIEQDPAQALAVAELEIARRQDVYTRDSYAWALYHAGEAGAARLQMAEALAIGVRDKRILTHAEAMGVGIPPLKRFGRATNE